MEVKLEREAGTLDPMLLLNFAFCSSWNTMEADHPIRNILNRERVLPETPDDAVDLDHLVHVPS